MRFAKIVFWCACVWGVLVLTPMYFLYDKVGEYSPPAPTHPEFYFAFLGAALVWQFAFLVIATDPVRFRMMIIPSVLEKFTYVLLLAVLYARGQITGIQLAPIVPDALLGLLFLIAFFKTRPHSLFMAVEANPIRS